MKDKDKRIIEMKSLIISVGTPTNSSGDLSLTVEMQDINGRKCVVIDKQGLCIGDSVTMTCGIEGGISFYEQTKKDMN